MKSTRTSATDRRARPAELETTVEAPSGARLALKEGTVTLPEGLALRLGGRIAPCRVAYRLLGAEGAPLVAVMGGISADRRVCAIPGTDEGPGWWEGIVGIGRGIDLTRWRVLAIDFLAGPGGSSAPDSPGPGIVPALTPADQADALRAVADRLELPRLHGVIGSSYGGAVALAFAADHAHRVDRALVIGAAHKTHPLATAVRVIQRRIVADAVARGDDRAGLALARALAMTTYRSQEEFHRRFDGPAKVGPDGVRFPVEEYLDHHGAQFADRFDAAEFLCLSLSMDLHHVDPARVRVPVTLVSMEPDSIAPAWQTRALFEKLGAGRELIEVASTSGHDGFLTDVDVFTGIVRDFLEK